jgi:hypothetical protein
MKSITMKCTFPSEWVSGYIVRALALTGIVGVAMGAPPMEAIDSVSSGHAPIVARSERANGRHFIQFNARGLDLTEHPGHSFVCLTDVGTGTGPVRECWGFANITGNPFGTGTLIFENYDAKQFEFIDVVLTAEISSEQRGRILGMASQLWANSDYNLFTRNCNAFIRDVAKEIGWVVPDMIVFRDPKSFALALAELNKKAILECQENYNNVCTPLPTPQPNSPPPSPQAPAPAPSPGPERLSEGGGIGRGARGDTPGGGGGRSSERRTFEVTTRIR